MILLSLSTLIILIMFLKLITSIHNLIFSKKILQEGKEKVKLNITEESNILLLIPVLREQSIIENTLQHFSQFELENTKLHVIVAGTIREKIDSSNFDFELTTEDITCEWITNYRQKQSREAIQFYYVEANDKQGDRATQLNYAVNYFKENYNDNIDIIGVYDADSLPDKTTLLEAISSFQDEKVDACQQPVHFIDAANELAQKKENPILVANALYQTTWTFIRELPRWKSYFDYSQADNKGAYGRNVYLIGHGEFITHEIYEKFKFPEYEVTDGIQLGYRLAMSNKSIKPLTKFCSDDVPRSISQIVSQHKRWFAGCMRLLPAYQWSKNNGFNKSILQILDGFWSQLSWAFAAPVSLLAIGSAIYLGDSVLLGTIATLVTIYCYLIPIIANSLLNIPIKVRLVDWLSLPLAIILKAVGPNLFLLEKAISKVGKVKEIKFKKVER